MFLAKNLYPTLVPALQALSIEVDKLMNDKG